MATNNSREQTVKSGEVVDGRYRIIKVIGEGGMGTVYLAEHTLIKRRVALKVLHPEFADDANVIERFMNEARAAGTLGHPNIVESTDMGFTDRKIPYIVFEYLEGTLLTDEIYRLGGLPVRRAVRIAQQMASGLHAAHAAGIVHRDLKSDNVFLTDKDDYLDHVKVLDFGISRFMEVDDEQTRRGMIMGTPEFMAPEQITAPDTVDARADVYALGVILYEMLTARRPFQNDDPRTLLHRIVHNEPPAIDRQGVPRELCDLIMRLLSKEPTARLASMLDVEAALAQFTTQSDAQPSMRRRTSMVKAVEVPTADTQIDIARVSRADIGKSVAVNTPWPAPASLVTVPPNGGKANVKMFAAAGFGVVGLGIAAFALLGGSKPAATPTAAPVVQVQTQAVAQSAATLPAGAPAAAPVAQKVGVEISADVPNARVTFRRRVSPAPVKMDVTATDIVEMVEVSAPGRKTVRYWLTFDRATTLAAKLPAGSGLVEATEEQTLVALGELKDEAATVAVAKVEPVTAPVRAAATNVQTNTDERIKVQKTVERPTPRKIGRGSADASLETATADAAPVVAALPAVAAPALEAVAAPVEPVAPAAPAASEPSAKAAIEAAPEKAKITDEATTKTEPVKAAPAKTEVVAAAVQPPAAAKPAPTPGLDKGVVNAVVSSHRGEILKCFADGRKANPGLKGTVNVTLTVSENGTVQRPQVKSTMGSPLVSACVAKAASSWKFPARAGGGVATVAYPFTLN